MAITSKFPIARQNALGTQVEDSTIAVLFADWTSAEEKDIFEPGSSFSLLSVFVIATY